MKKYYVITLSAVFMLVIMQVNYIRTVYGEYNNQCKNEINNIIYTSIDREINIRTELFTGQKIVRAHDLTPVNFRNLFYRLLLEQKT